MRLYLEYNHNSLNEMNTILKNLHILFRSYFQKYFILLFILSTQIFSNEILIAQQNDVYFEHISYKENLSQSTVNSILKDEIGFLWFGTEDGLNMYDGNRIKVYKHDLNDPCSLSSSLIWSIYEDASGTMWIGTFNGLNSYNREMDSFTSYLNDPENPASLSDNYVRAIVEDNNGNLWIGTNMGLNRFDKETKNFTTYIEPPEKEFAQNGNTINTMIVDHLGKLWIGTNKGLKVYNDRSDSFIEYNLHDGPLKNRINSIFEDDKGILWIGTENSGLYIFNRQTENFKNFDLGFNKVDSKLTIEAIAGSPNKCTWVATDKGLFRISKENNLVDAFYHDPLNDHSISENSIRSLFSENNGFVWIGGINSGVNLVNPSKNRFHHIASEYNKPNHLKDNKIRSLAENNQANILIGTTEGGLCIYNPISNDFINLKGNIEKYFNGQSISSLCVGSDNIYWIGIRRNGLIRYDPKNGNYRHYLNDSNNPNSLSSNNIISIIIDKSGMIWVGTNGDGLNMFNPDTEIFTRYIHNPDSPGSISNNRIYSIMEDHLGELWIATAGGGLNRFNRKTQNFISYNKIPNDSSNFYFNYFLSIHEDKKGNIWAGTFGKGLIKYSREHNLFTSLTEKDGLPNNVIYGILGDDNGNLWLSHNQGIAKFDIENEQFVNYDVRDGLQGNEFNSSASFKTSNGHLIFGGNNGFNIFHPDSIRENSNIPKIVFTNLKILNKKIPVGETDDGRIIIKKSITHAKEINLLHSDREIYIEFSALDYAVPGKNMYKYRLIGEDDAWINLGTANSLSFHKPPYGSTILQIIGSNNDGVWNEEGVLITINVKPPFYGTVLFKILGIIILLSLVMLLYYLRMNNLRGQKKELELLVQTKTKEISQQRDDLEQKNEELEIQNRIAREQKDKTAEMAKRLDEANQSKLQFFTNISHEFRTPLTLIMNFIEKLLEPSSKISQTERKEDYLMIEKNANKLLKLINRLMQFRKLTTQQTILKVSENDLIDFIKNQAILYKSLADKKDINYSFQSKEKSMMLCFDPEQIEEVITNLLSNAFKFTPNHSSIKVSVGTANDPALASILNGKLDNPEDYKYFSIEDYGIGIPLDKQTLIFKRFFQVDQARDVSETGTGIGLHISDMIIKLHKGKIFVRSVPGEGSTFAVLLKTGKSHFNKNEFNDAPYKASQNIIIEEELITNTSENSELDELNSTIEQLSKKDLPRILIIEDNHDLRKFILKGLESSYRLTGVETGEQALKLIEEFDPEVIISDVLLPGEINGFDLVEQIKTNLTTSHIPVIMLTALDSTDQKILGLEKGADIYMTKPFSLRELKAHVKGLIQSRITLKKKFREQAFINSRELDISDKDETFIQKSIRIIEAGMSDPQFDVSVLCDAMNMSQTKLYRKLKALTDMTITDFIRGLRLRRAAALLLETDRNVSEIAYEVGFNDPNYFGKCFKTQFGLSPSEFLKEQKSK